MCLFIIPVKPLQHWAKQTWGSHSFLEANKKCLKCFSLAALFSCSFPSHLSVSALLWSGHSLQGFPGSTGQPWVQSQSQQLQERARTPCFSALCSGLKILVTASANRVYKLLASCVTCVNTTPTCKSLYCHRITITVIIIITSIIYWCLSKYTSTPYNTWHLKKTG